MRIKTTCFQAGALGLTSVCSNIVKKWKQVWPTVPFPLDTSKGTKRKGVLSSYIREHAGDVVDIVVSVDGTGVSRAIPKRLTQEAIAVQSLNKGSP